MKERDWRQALRKLGEAAVGCDLGDESIYLAEELVAQAWMLGESERLALALLVLAVAAAERQGSTRLPLEGAALGRRVAELCAAGQLAVEPSRVVRDIRRLAGDPRPGLVSLIGRPGDDRPLIASGGAVATHRLHACETRLAAFVASRRAAPTLPFIETALAEVAASPIRLSDEQRAAVAHAASRALAVVSGGPGTGKTAIVAALCRALVRSGVAPSGILLAAPTGKAAQRLGASVRSALAGAEGEADRRLAAELPEARTLHRLLGYQPDSGRFHHHAGAPLRGEVVIVDEASMVDLVLMERLARALAPATRLVLFGDADQLPSVEAGAVLRDLAAGDACRLTRSYRMDESDPAGRAILEAARAVRAGRVGPWPVPDPVPASGLVDDWFDARIAAGGRWAELARALARLEDGDRTAEIAELAQLFESSRMLSVTRRLRRGTEALNRLFHRRAAAALGVADAARFDLLPGEPVVVRENDHARGLYNGDCGLVASAGRGAGALRAVFAGQDGSWRIFPLAALRPRLELAYALTVHQSQGSEYDHVALVLPDADLPLATRELVYTALTRARRSIALFGTAEVLRAAVARSAERFSGLR
ncbi:MAG TPA: AAA family ATPase [Kofleriaceae bacterium]|nr:AAA family ATPase [Kofleriaceae bacterium]